MSQEGYFLCVDLLGLGPLSGCCVLARFTGLTLDEASLIRQAVEREARSHRLAARVWLEIESEVRKDQARFLALCQQAKNMDCIIHETPRSDLTKQRVYQLALAASDCAAEVLARRAEQRASQPAIDDVPTPAAMAGALTKEDSTGKPKHGSVNAQMLETIQSNPDAMSWNSPRWAKHLKCGKSTVVETQIWKDLRMRRERERAERALDRHRKPRASDQRRD